MLIILTHDNQSSLSSFSLFLIFVTNTPMAEKALSDLVLIVIKATRTVLSRLFDLFFVASKIEIDRYGFFEADPDISKIFISCFLLHSFFQKLQKSGFMN